MKKKILISVILFLALCYGIFRITKLSNFQFFGGLINRVETDKKVIALTFDDAPTEYTNEVLDILKEKNIKTTFYVIGKNIEEHPEQAKRILSDGHEMGNHSYSHSRMVLKTLPFIASEIQKTNTLIKNLGYKKEITFRPPYGKKLILLPWYLHQHNIKTLTWDVDPDTYFPGDKNAMVTYTLKTTKPGSIIILHPFCTEQCKAAREALPVIIDELQKEGYTFVTISELLKLN